MSRIIRLAVLCCVVFAGSERTASACSCAMGRMCASYWDVDRVFTGRAEVTASGKGWQTTRFRVEESFRGPSGAVVEIVSRGIGGSCAFTFVHGTRYLVYARRAADGTWSAMYCDPTAPLEQAGEGLAFARGVARDTRRGGQLSGFVSVADRAGDGQSAPHSPLSQVRVTLRGRTREFSTDTDSRGQYRLDDVPPGRYVVTVSTPAGIAPVSPATIEIKGPGACATHVVSAARKPTR